MKAIVFLAFCLAVLVTCQEELLSDPNFETIILAETSEDRDWKFRAEYVYYDPGNLYNIIDPRVDLGLELPTEAIQGVTRGNTTNVNRVRMPDIPTVTNPVTYPAVAAAVDYSAPCRVALWTSFTVTNQSADNELSLKLWARSISGATTVLADDTLVGTTGELEYLYAPDGPLTVGFGLLEVVSFLRIDIMSLPDDGFFDSAFSTDVLLNVPILDWVDGQQIPAVGTNGAFVDITANVSSVTSTPGTYILRIASAHTNVGTTYAVADASLTTTGGVDPEDLVDDVELLDIIVDQASLIVGGTLRLVTAEAAIL